MNTRKAQNLEERPETQPRNASDLLANCREIWERRFDRLSAYLRANPTA